MAPWVWLLLLLVLLFRGPRLFLLGAFGILMVLGVAVLAVVGGLVRSLLPGRPRLRSRSRTERRGAAQRDAGPEPDPDAGARLRPRRTDPEAPPYDPAAVVDARFEEVE